MMLIGSMQPQKDVVKKNITLTSPIELIEWGFDDTQKNKSLFLNFKKDIQSNSYFQNIVFKNPILHNQINNHNIFDPNLINKLETFLKIHIPNKEVQKWKQNLILTRGTYCLTSIHTM